MKTPSLLFGAVCVIACSLALGITQPAAQAEECVPEDAALLIKGSCALGAPLKFKLAGPPEAKFRLHVETPDDPLPIPGQAPFCPTLSREIPSIATGRLNSWGFRSVWWSMPDDPGLVGEPLRFWFATLNRPGDGAISVSNPIEIEICEDESGGECNQGIRRLGYFTVLRYSEGFPATLSTRAYRRGHTSDLVGEITLEYDPEDPPELPITTEDGGLTVTKLQAFPGLILLHSVVKGCNHANGRLPNETTFESEVGTVFVQRDIHTSCSIPIHPGARFKPLTISFVQDVASAPPGDCDP